MVHLRIVAPGHEARKALELLMASEAVVNVVHLPGFARKPEGDVILCDVARRDASIVMAELRQLGIAYVITDRSAGDAPQIAGEVVYEGGALLVQRLPERDHRMPGTKAGPAVVGAWVAYCLAWLEAATSTVLLLISMVRRPTAKVRG